MRPPKRILFLTTKILAMQQRARGDNLTICKREKEIDVSSPCVCPVVENEFRHNIVKVKLSPREFTATSTSLGKFAINIPQQTHEKLTSIYLMETVKQSDLWVNGKY